MLYQRFAKKWYCSVEFLVKTQEILIQILINIAEILHGQTTDEPLFTTVFDKSGAREKPSIVVITLVITSFIIGTTCVFLCICFILTRRKRRKTKVTPKQDHIKIEVWPVNENKNNFQICNRTQKMELKDRNKGYKIVSKLTLEWNEVEI